MDWCTVARPDGLCEVMWYVGVRSVERGSESAVLVVAAIVSDYIQKSYDGEEENGKPQTNSNIIFPA